MINRFMSILALCIINVIHPMDSKQQEEQAIAQVLTNELEMCKQMAQTGQPRNQNSLMRSHDYQTSNDDNSYPENDTLTFQSGSSSSTHADTNQYVEELFKKIIDYRTDFELTDEEQTILDLCPKHLLDIATALHNEAGPITDYAPSSLLLVGETGVGKTVLSQVLAKFSKSKFIKIQMIMLMGFCLEEKNKDLKKIISPYLHSDERVVMLLDDIDTAAYDEHNNYEKNYYLTQILKKEPYQQQNPNLFIIGTSNSVEDIARSVIQNFEIILTIEKPNFDHRKQILKIQLNKDNIQFNTNDLDYLARECDELTPRDLVKIRDNLVLLAKLEPLALKKNGVTPLGPICVTQKHIDDAIDLLYKSSILAGTPRNALLRRVYRIIHSPDFYPNAQLVAAVTGGLLVGATLAAHIIYYMKRLNRK